MKTLTVLEKHQLAIARKTMTLSCVGCLVLGGPNHKQATAILSNLTGKIYIPPQGCTCQWPN